MTPITSVQRTSTGAPVRDRPQRRTGVVYAVAALSALATAAGCSLQTYDRAECDTDEQCVSAFGAGATCGGDGLCELPGGSACGAADDCLTADGFGTACQGAGSGSGTCVGAAAAAPERCAERAFPGDLLDNPSAHTDRLVIGAIADLGVRSHRDRADAIELAAANISDNGGLDGRPLGVVFCDIDTSAQSPYGGDRRRPDVAVETARWLVEGLGVAGIVGPPWSGDAQRVYADVTNAERNRGETVLVSPSATDPALTDLDLPDDGGASDERPGLLWRTAPSGVEQVSVLVSSMESDGVTSVAIVGEASPFAGTFLDTGESLAQSFGDAWSGDDEQFTYEGGNASEREEKVGEAGFELSEGTFDAVLFIGPLRDTRAFLAQATAGTAYDDVPIYVTATAATDELFEGIEDSRLFGNVSATAVPPPSSFVHDNFQASFQSRFGADPDRSPFAAHAYDATWLLALGMTWALYQGEGTVTDTASGYPLVHGTDVAVGLRRTAAGTAVQFVPSSWQTALSQYGSGQPVDVEGAASEYAFDLDIEEAPGAAELVQASADGSFGLP